MWHPARVAGGARLEHRLGRAAGALGVGAVRVEPEAQRDSDRIRPGMEEGHGTVDAAAHRDRDPSRARRRAEDLGQRIRKRVRSQRLARDAGSFEQRQAHQRSREPIGVGADDPVSLHRDPNEGKVAVARRVSEDLDHPARLAEHRESSRFTSKITRGEPKLPPL